MFRLHSRSCFLNDPTRSKTVDNVRKTNDKVLSKAIPLQPKTSTNGVVADTRPTAQVDLTGKITCINNTYGEGDERNKYITYTANKLIEAGLVDGYYNYLDFLATWQHESDWQVNALNTGNSNGTTDHGICQLNSKWHGKYILSDPVAMADPYAQIDYCVGVAVDAKNKGTMPWSAWKNGSKNKHKQKFECKTFNS